MQIYLRKSCGKMDFDEVLMRVSAIMVDILGIYVCVSQKKVVPLQRKSNNIFINANKLNNNKLCKTLIIRHRHVLFLVKA